jgi:hypothetical protein
LLFCPPVPWSAIVSIRTPNHFDGSPEIAQHRAEWADSYHGFRKITEAEHADARIAKANLRDSIRMHLTADHAESPSEEFTRFTNSHRLQVTNGQSPRHLDLFDILTYELPSCSNAMRMWLFCHLSCGECPRSDDAHAFCSAGVQRQRWMPRSGVIQITHSESTGQGCCTCDSGLVRATGISERKGRFDDCG